MQLKILTFLQSPFIKSSIARKVAPLLQLTNPAPDAKNPHEIDLPLG
jgi:hypothetical protein